jgi:hypothetical protein
VGAELDAPPAVRARAGAGAVTVFPVRPPRCRLGGAVDVGQRARDVAVLFVSGDEREGLRRGGTEEMRCVLKHATELSAHGAMVSACSSTLEIKK